MENMRGARGIVACKRRDQRRSLSRRSSTLPVTGTSKMICTSSWASGSGSTRISEKLPKTSRVNAITSGIYLPTPRRSAVASTSSDIGERAGRQKRLELRPVQPGWKTAPRHHERRRVRLISRPVSVYRIIHRVILDISAATNRIGNITHYEFVIPALLESKADSS